MDWPAPCRQRVGHRVSCTSGTGSRCEGRELQRRRRRRRVGAVAAHLALAPCGGSAAAAIICAAPEHPALPHLAAAQPTAVEGSRSPAAGPAAACCPGTDPRPSGGPGGRAGEPTSTLQPRTAAGGGQSAPGAVINVVQRPPARDHSPHLPGEACGARHGSPNAPGEGQRPLPSLPPVCPPRRA